MQRWHSQSCICVFMQATPNTINDWSIANLFYYANPSRAGTLGEGQPGGSTLQCVHGRLRESLDKLLQASLPPSSRAHYERTWKKLVNFHVSLGLPTRLPFLVPMVLLFIAHLYANGSAPASIVSTVSAVACFHKINGFHDPSNCFMVSKLLAGARNLGTIPDVRLPVTCPVLSRLGMLYPPCLHLGINVLCSEPWWYWHSKLICG